MKKLKNIKEIVVIVSILFVFIILLSYELVITILNTNANSNSNVLSSNEQSNLVSTNNYSELKEIYKYNKTINSDYSGQIYFESGLIDLPFVQGETIDTYLRKDWITGEYEIGGSIFYESSNDIYNDQNIIIYGHNYPKSYDSSLSKMFTPLRYLKEKDNYEDNKIIDLFIGDKLLRYEIVSVFRVGIIEEDGVQYIAEDEPIYVLKNYSKDDFDEYIEKVKQREYYDTGVIIESSDRLLTLQTCFDDSIDKLVVLAKLIEEIPVE